MATGAAVKTALRIGGIVQGVGFRPFVARLAREHGLCGSVRNVAGEVQVEVTGEPMAVERFCREIAQRSPAASHIHSLHRQDEASPDSLPEGFFILPSGEDSPDAAVSMPAPDLATCPDCLQELFSPGDPRHGNAFISCTHCGPRFSILHGLPYDRDATTMANFPLCPLCRKQYADPDDRRYHAQTVCCNACGPTLTYRDRRGATYRGGDALEAAVRALKGGGIVAVKGIGGYHLACDPASGGAVARLRALKGREQKPFAVLFPDPQMLKQYCAVSEDEAALLDSPARPIVLLRRTGGDIDPGVYTGSAELGVFLAYTPLQHLLLHAIGPLVMTSANASGLPLIIDDADMRAFAAAHVELEGVLGHDRAILQRVDDSVTAMACGQPMMIRRARGYVPLPLPLPTGGPALLACGAQQKNTFCLYRDGQVFLSAEIGDLDSREVEAVYRETIVHMQSLLRVEPALAVCDLHPGYGSTRYARASGLPVLTVQHHHAHIASVLAEHGLDEQVIGVAFDGTGYGEDGTVWGGEFLIASPRDFTRAGHLKPLPMLGGDSSIPQAWKSAACYLADAGIAPPDDRQSELVRAALKHEVHTLRSSSMGRAFDAASALLDICQVSGYDGQAAIALEQAAARACSQGGAALPLPWALEETDGRLAADLSPCFQALWALRPRESVEALALAFHATVAEIIVKVCARLSERHGLRKVALSGGVFLNRLLLHLALPGLEATGLTVLRHRQMPAGDAGLSLGQAYIGLMTRLDT